MKLFLGLIFILLDIEIPVGSGVLNLIPDFVGYFLVMKGLEERDDVWRHGAFGLMLVSLVLFVADLVAVDAGIRVVFWCVELAAEIVMLLLARRIIGNRKGGKELFPVLACMRVLTILLGWIPLVGTVCTAANAVVAVCFLAAYRKSGKE